MELVLPKVYIRSKAELAKHLSTPKSYDSILDDINEALNNIQKLYFNHSNSTPNEWKFIRVAKWPLKKVNNKINEFILKPIDRCLPFFIFWGVSGKNHIKAVKEHKSKNKRAYIKLDLQRYFDQITQERVIWNLVSKLWCSPKWAYFIASMCCVPEWEKYSDDAKKLIARGFHTSSRLAILCSIEFFMRLNYFLQNKYSHLNPKVSVYVDDITISLDESNTEILQEILTWIKKLSEKYNLILNDDKEEIIEWTYSTEILWIKLENWKMKLWKKSLGRKKDAYKRWNLGDKSAVESIKWFKGYQKTLYTS